MRTIRIIAGVLLVMSQAARLLGDAGADC